MLIRYLIKTHTSTSVTGAARGIIEVPEYDNLTKVHIQLTNTMYTHHRSTIPLTSNFKLLLVFQKKKDKGAKVF